MYLCIIWLWVSLLWCCCFVFGLVSFCILKSTFALISLVPSGMRLRERMWNQWRGLTIKLSNLRTLASLLVSRRAGAPLGCIVPCNVALASNDADQHMEGARPDFDSPRGLVLMQYYWRCWRAGFGEAVSERLREPRVLQLHERLCKARVVAQWHRFVARYRQQRRAAAECRNMRRKSVLWQCWDMWALLCQAAREVREAGTALRGQYQRRLMEQALTSWRLCFENLKELTDAADL